ncbi:Lipoprotein-anchoring transpeptidase ErfK/SrfK [Sphingomonas laterariae]|uniref:Lipoprotein-anchoring transpeptidase ErfK/SrfK n=1 Tax=Edaphosphingomonas laterariae TaxID=861865 RepID=A0A239DN18_9SPHN|nr:L,D-transpeptidase family protein [Sphingomonas laterariae]SNS33886.1 Lipoprotein-anchoring transpeptidase ErfK/SrfK [Sphingomonas laterariae]
MKLRVALIGTTFATLALPASSFAAAPQSIDLSVMHAQVILDRLGFSPGVIDGKQGQSLSLALKGFQTANGLKPTGELDPSTLKALSAWRAIRPTRSLQLTDAIVAGPYYGRLPRDMAKQSDYPALGYANLLERLAEKFHTTPDTIAALNPPGTRLKAGQTIRLPGALPSSRAYPADLPAAWRKTLSDLNVDARQPDVARIVVDRSDAALRAYDARNRLVAQFPATMGSEHDPLPLGSWKIQGAAYNPPFHYNPDLFWDASSKEEKAKLPPGPNGPVGVVWLDINKPHYGIHGTPNPEQIGRTESHGCIRLTNWDAARLALMVKPGTPARFQE